MNVRLCIEECCRIPDDGIVVFRVEVDDWLLAPHEACGDEPQCGPVRITPVPRLEDSQWYELEVETTAPTVAVNLLDIAASQVNPRERWVTEWWLDASVVPRPEVDIDLPWYGATFSFRVEDEQARLERDRNQCNNAFDRFSAYAEIAPTTPPGTYTLRADLDDVAVTCTFEVLTSAAGHAEIASIPEDSCAPGDLVLGNRLTPQRVGATPDGVPAGYRRVVLTPEAPVEGLRLTLSRGEEILVEGSHEPGGEIVHPAGELCTLAPCQVAERWGVTLWLRAPPG